MRSSSTPKGSLSSSSGSRRLNWMLWSLAALAAAATVAVLLGAGKRVSDLDPSDGSIGDSPEAERRVAARVGGSVLYHEDMVLAGIEDPALLEEWVDDQLLADLALRSGLENPRRTRLLQERVRQLYLRDELLSSTYSAVPFPDPSEVLETMDADSAAYLVERHYFHILVSQRQMADSIHQRLSWGENFQLTAENVSLGQKAGIGGDLGFMTAGELMAYGIPRDNVLLDGLGEPVQSPYGWHILMVDEVRPLEDTARVIRTVADDIHRSRMQAARDSLLRVAALEEEIYIDPSLLGDDNYEETGDTIEGSETQ